MFEVEEDSAGFLGAGGGKGEAGSDGGGGFVVDGFQPEGLDEEGAGAGGDLGAGTEVPAIDAEGEGDVGEGLRVGEIAGGVYGG